MPEAAGGGPEDPIADAVAAACVPLCTEIFDTMVEDSAKEICKAADLC